MSDPLFGSKEPDATPTDQVDVAIDQLKAKYTLSDGTIDVDAVLKKAAHADKHISTIESENSNLRSEVDKRLTYEDLLGKINAQRASASNDEPTGSDERDTSGGKQMSEQELRSLLRSEAQQMQQEALQVANVQFAATEMAKVWGSDYISKLKQRARDLNLDEDTLRNLAMKNPKGFLNVVLTKEQSQENYTPPTTQVRSSATTRNTAKNWNYYKNLQKTDPKTYRSNEVQKEMHSEAAKQGESFYS